MRPAAPDVPDLDPQRIAELIEVVGAARLKDLFGQLAQQVEGIDTAIAASLAPTLHRLRGTSASLGLSRLAAEMATLLQEIEGADHPDLASRLAAIKLLHARSSAAALAVVHAAGASNE